MQLEKLLADLNSIYLKIYREELNYLKLLLLAIGIQIILLYQIFYYLFSFIQYYYIQSLVNTFIINITFDLLSVLRCYLHFQYI